MTSHVNNKIVDKSISGEHINIKRPLPSLHNKEEEELKLGELKEKKLSFYEWIWCVRVLKSISSSHYPNVQGMLRHEEIVQDLHGQGKDGMYYDAQFRRRKHQHPHIG